MKPLLAFLYIKDHNIIPTQILEFSNFVVLKGVSCNDTNGCF